MGENLSKRISNLLRSHIFDVVMNIERNINMLKTEKMGEPGGFDYIKIALYEMIISSDRLHESSKRLERLTWVLIGLTTVLGILTVILMLRTFGIV